MTGSAAAALTEIDIRRWYDASRRALESASQGRLAPPEPPITRAEIADAETALGQQLPSELVALYLTFGGGPNVLGSREIMPAGAKLAAATELDRQLILGEYASIALPYRPEPDLVTFVSADSHTTGGFLYEVSGRYVGRILWHGGADPPLGPVAPSLGAFLELHLALARRAYLRLVPWRGSPGG